MLETYRPQIRPVFYGTRHDWAALAFGEKIIARQAGMKARLDAVLADVQRRASAGGDADDFSRTCDISKAAMRQGRDYQRRAGLMCEHHQLLVAVAERARQGAVH